MGLQDLDGLTGGLIPEPGRPVVTSGDHLGTVRGDGYCDDLAAVTSQHVQALARDEILDCGGAIMGGAYGAPHPG